MEAHGQGPEGGGERERALAERLQRLEESVAFSTHEADLLGAHVRALMGRIDGLAARVDRLEARLARMNDPQEPEAGAG